MANPLQLEILKKGVETWNSWRKENEALKIDLEETNFRGEDLRLINFSKANLSKADLSNADLRKSDFREADLRSANLRRSDLRGADLKRAILEKAILRRADLRKADLTGANLILTNLRKADLRRAILEEAILGIEESSKSNPGRTNLRGADLRKAIFSKADLRLTDMRNADLRGAILLFADMTRANLRGADLTGANLIMTTLHLANLRNSHLNSALLLWANLEEANLRLSDLIGANLNKVNLIGARLEEANLNGAFLRWAALDRANLKNANLSEADLFKANLTEARLQEANLTKANLSKARFIETSLDKTILSETVLGKTIFAFTSLDSVKGLDEIYVTDSCSIDFETLKNSQNLPKSFLFKIGLPRKFIGQLPDFYQDKLDSSQFALLSHSSTDTEFASLLYSELIRNGVPVWWDQKKSKPGEDGMDQNSEPASESRVILVCSKTSLSSWWIEKEIDKVYAQEKRLEELQRKRVQLLATIIIDDEIMTWKGKWVDLIRDRLVGDFRNWEKKELFQSSFNKLALSLYIDTNAEGRIHVS